MPKNVSSVFLGTVQGHTRFMLECLHTLLIHSYMHWVMLVGAFCRKIKNKSENKEDLNFIT